MSVPSRGRSGRGPSTEPTPPAKQPPSLRTAIAWVGIALAYALALSFYKGAALERLAKDRIRGLETRHASVLRLFQASFYFFYGEQFVPGIRKALGEGDGLERIQVLSSTGKLLFDSADLPKGASPLPAGAQPVQPQDHARPFPHREVIARLAQPSPSLFTAGFRIQVLMPAGQYGVLYTFDGSAIRFRVLALLGGGLGAAALLAWLLGRASPLGAFLERAELVRASLGRLWGLRSKFLFTIVLINLITGSIVFVTLSALQTREETQRIRKESLLFAQFSTAQVISDFSNYFYFFYAEKFLPGIKTIVSTNENLMAIRIISRRTGVVLFDSEQVGWSGSAPQPAGDSTKAEFPPDIEADLKARDVVARDLERGGETLLSVVNTYRNENKEAVFFVEYLFSFRTLVGSLRAIRRQILVDLVPSLALGMLIAAVFAQLLISPIRRLVVALHRVTAGDYDVSVELHRSDEIGEVVSAFNSMTSELRKKKELRKYLSDSTYRQVMEAPDTPEGARIGGTRVEATVLFSDIRNFVGHCENLDAEEVTAMLNEYFAEMVEVVYKHGGEVDKFIGDALLAVFYAGEEVRTIRSALAPTGPSATATSLQAIGCALEMRDRLVDFNARREAAGKARIEIGVGITHGEIISGPIGAKDRMDFTVIGDVVNLASRIEKLSKAGRHTKIVFSEHVEVRVRNLLDYEQLATEVIPGKEERIAVFELIRIRDLDALASQLSSEDPHVRRCTVELLGQSRNRGAIPHVLATLADADEAVRLVAIQASTKLAEPDEPAVLDALFERMGVEASDKTIASLVTAIGRVCTGDRILELGPLLESPNERIVANAVEALGQVRSPRATDLILPRLSSRNNRVKANAAMALFAAGHIEVIDVLKPMLMHSDPLMRSSAAFAIGELTALAQRDQILEAWKTRPHGVRLFLAELQECVPMLVTLLKDGEPMVKRQAIIALGKVKDRSAVLPILDAIDLSADSKEMIRDVAGALRAIGSHKLVREVLARLIV